MSFLKEVLKTLPIGVGVPVLIGAASISPHDAASNFSKWADEIGIHDLPVWLTQAADRRVIYAAWAAVPLYAFLAWGVPAIKRRYSKPEPAQSAPQPDIGAREAFFQILEGSKWTQEQLETTTDTKHLVFDWLEVRLNTEIHKALRNSLLASWGEECLRGTATTPEKPIPPETWDKMEIVFDRAAHFPRTAAHWKGRTSREIGRMAWIAIKFSKDQIFHLFPPAPKPHAAPEAVPSGGFSLRFPELRSRIPLQEAARLAYEAAENSGILELTTSASSSPETKLRHFKFLFMVDDETQLYGVKPPSTKSRPISKADLVHLCPADGDVSELNSDVSHGSAIYVNVTLRRNDLRRVINSYIAEAKRYAK
jgi:hypothetical protein